MRGNGNHVIFFYFASTFSCLVYFQDINGAIHEKPHQFAVITCPCRVLLCPMSWICIVAQAPGILARNYMLPQVTSQNDSQRHICANSSGIKYVIHNRATACDSPVSFIFGIVWRQASSAAFAILATLSPEVGKFAGTGAQTMHMSQIKELASSEGTRMQFGMRSQIQQNFVPV